MHDESVFRSILLIGLLVVIPITACHRFRAHTGERLDRRQEGCFVLYTLRPLGFTMMAGLFAYLARPSSMEWAAIDVPHWLRWVGVAIGIAGGALLTWTLRALGGNLTDTVVTRKRHTLVTTGPYRFVRHPFCGALAVIVSANALVAANWFLAATGALFILLLALRSGREEKNLLARFGDRYRSYREATGRFLPRVRRR
jgi:protein-S-isoprenylcysteine O-methyltransferase Ste14